eukprot:m.326304 g.326304  ORF g.326304 m.326304 type:complete len:247 (+) comp16478_c0_seq15:332-1072(+)
MRDCVGTTLLFSEWTRTRCSTCVPKRRVGNSGNNPSDLGVALRDSHRKTQSGQAAASQVWQEQQIADLEAAGCTVILPDGSRTFPNTFFGNFQHWWHYQMLSIGVRKPVLPRGPASFPAEAEPMQAETAGGDVAGVGGNVTDVDAAYPTPLPTFVPISVFQDDAANLLDVSEVNSHTAVLGKSGDGKTHLTCHLIMQWAPIKGWNHGWVAAIMPRPTWENNTLYSKLLDPALVYFVDDYPSKDDRD